MPETTPPLTGPLLAWVDHRRRRVLGLVLLVYLAGFNGQWRPGPDSAEHVTIAQRLIDGQGFTHPTGWHEQLNAGLAYLLAAVGAPFGRVHFALSLTVMLLIAIATLAAAYALLYDRFGRPTAVALTAILALTQTFYRLSFELLTDMPFCFGLMLMLLGWAWIDRAGRPDPGGDKGWRRGAGWALLVVGVAVMTLFRSVVISVLVGVTLYGLWELCNRRWRGVAQPAACIATWFLVQMLARVGGGHDERRAIEQVFTALPQTLARMLRENLPTLATENAAEALFAVDMGPVVSVLLLAAIVVVWVRLTRVQRLWGLITAAFFVQWLLFMPGNRYFLPVLLPLLVGWWEAARWVERRWREPWASRLAAAMLVLWVAPNVVRIGAMIVEQRRVPFLQPEQVQLRTFGERIAKVVEPDALVIGAEGQLLTWYSGRRVLDPKQLRVRAGLDRERIAAEIAGFDKIYLIEPYDVRQGRVIKRLPVRPRWPIVTVDRGEGRVPWTLHPTRPRRSAIEPGQLDDQDDEQSDREDH